MRARSLCVVVLLCPVLAAGQSLGEAAAREKQRRKTTAGKAAGAKTYTDQDLPTTRAGTPGDPPGRGARSETPAASAAGGDEGARQAELAQEFEWKARANEARARIRAAEEALRLAEQRADEVERRAIELVAADSDLERVAKLKARDEARGELSAARQQLTDLEEDARRAGVPPGWLRE
jgi:hypothetical protein